FVEAAVECVQGDPEIIEKSKADKCKGEVAAALGKRQRKCGAVHETSNVIDHGGAEERPRGFEKKGRAIGAGDGEVAPKEEPQLGKDAHVQDSSAATEISG